MWRTPVAIVWLTEQSVKMSEQLSDMLKLLLLKGLLENLDDDEDSDLKNQVMVSYFGSAAEKFRRSP